MPAPSVPLFHAQVPDQARNALLRVLDSGQIAGGPLVAEFEAAIAADVKRPHLVALSDMSQALTMALRLAGVGPGDEVLTLAFSCMSSNSPIANVGATPVWIDIDPQTASMSCNDLRRCISKKTKAVTLYHVSGYPGSSEEIARICKEHGLAFIEDCNNAWGALAAPNQQVGTFGDYAVYSFYPNRHVNALEGGALACPEAQSAAQARRLRRFGIDMASFRDSRGEINPQSAIPQVGWSASLAQTNAAVGLVHLKDVRLRLTRQRRIAALFDDAFSTLKQARPVQVRSGATASYWTYMLLADDRDRWLASLKAQGIGASTLHARNDIYAGFNARSRALAGTDDFTARMLAIPCGWWVSDEDAARIVDTIRSLDKH